MKFNLVEALKMIDPWMFFGLITGSILGYFVLASYANLVDELLKVTLKGSQEEILGVYSMVPVLFTVFFGFLGAVLGLATKALCEFVIEKFISKPH